jgi:hypothetical protein
MLKSILKSPIGMAIAAGALILALSPEARKAVKRLAVKGTEMFGNASEQIKSYASGFETNPKNDISTRDLIDK